MFSSFAGYESAGGFVNENAEKEMSFLHGGTTVPSMYSPFMAATADTHNRTFLPLKIGMIYRAYNRNPTATRVVLYGGEEVPMFKLIGTVHDFQHITDVGAEKHVFDLHDGTGSIRVEYLIGIKAEANSVWMTQYHEKFAMEGAAAPIYVKVFGETNLRGIHEPRVKAITVSRIGSPYEMIKHDLDVALYHLRHNNNAPNNPNQSFEVKNDTSPINSPMYQSGPPSAIKTTRGTTRNSVSELVISKSPGGGRPVVDYDGSVESEKTPSPLVVSEMGGTAKHIYNFLSEMADSHPQGVHIKVIGKKMGKSQPQIGRPGIIVEHTGLSVTEVRKYLEELEDQGDAYFGKNHDFWTAL